MKWIHEKPSVTPPNPPIAKFQSQIYGIIFTSSISRKSPLATKSKFTKFLKINKPNKKRNM